MRISNFHFILFGIIGLLCSCISSNQLLNHLRTESGYCDPPLVFTYDSSARPQEDIPQVLDSVLIRKYTHRSLLVANATGVLINLKELESESKENLIYLRKKQEIIMQLLLASTEIASTAAELDCEAERAQQVANFLLEKETRRVKRLTIFSITVGAITGIASSATHSHSAAEAVAIVGGLTGAGLGLSALFSTRRILFNHPRNLLTDIWKEKKNSLVYPPAIGYMLSEKYFSNAQQEAISSNMKQRWIQFEGLGQSTKKSQRLQQLLFGPGGYYKDEELRARARMLNQVQAAVKLMNQDLQGLIAELSR